MASAVGPGLAEAVGHLLPQLTGVPPPGPEGLERALADAAATLLVARQGEAVVGLALVAVYAKLTGVEGRLEDVVVDGSHRGEGVGRALVEAAIEVARSRGAGHLELTSGPRREAANRLYQRLGFRLRETNVYRLPL